MLRRHIGLVLVLLVAFSVLVAAGIIDPNWSAGDVASYAAFAAIFVYIASRLLTNQDRRNSEDPGDGPPRVFRVVFASLALALALTMLLSVATLPWLGLEALDHLIGRNASWGLPLLAALLYPLVQRRLR